MTLPSEFETSYINFDTYPHNVIAKTSFFGALDFKSERFNECSDSLFVANENKSDVVFRDFDISGQPPRKENVKGDVTLRKWLGESIDPLTNLRIGEWEKRGTRCRFVFIWADSSRAPLKISKGMFLRLMTYHQVMPSFLDFISVFGPQTRPKELRFSGFREQTTLDLHGIPIPDLRRSGRQFQLSYNLKSIHRTSPPILNGPDGHIWSIRHAVIHHQFDVVYGTTLWIMTKGNLELQMRIKDMTGPQGRTHEKTFDTPENCFRSTFGVHLMCAQFSAQGWRSYVQWLESVVDLHTSPALDDARSDYSVRPEYTPQNLQMVQGYEDKTNEAVMIMEANINVMESLKEYYSDLLDNTNFDIRDVCRNDIKRFIRELDDIISEIKMQVRRAELLVRIIGDRKVLVLQHLQSQATEKMEVLTVSMHNIGTMSQREAIIMRIITVAALIYLPATFVSSFFSTDVVKYQDQPKGGKFSSSAMYGWLEVTLPLTFVTLVGAILWFFYADKQRKKELYSQLPKAGMKFIV